MQSVYRYQQNVQGNLTKILGVACDGLASHPGGVVPVTVELSSGLISHLGLKAYFSLISSCIKYPVN